MVAAEYNRLIYRLTGWRGAFPLIVPIRVGDYFELREDGVPVLLGNAFDWPGWSRDTVGSEAIAGSETYYSGCQRKTGAQAGAGVRVPGGVGVQGTLSLSFTREAGFVLAYDAATRSRMRDQVRVRRRILERARSGSWQQNWILAVDVIAADSATLAVATEKDSELDLHANAAIPAGIAGVTIAKPTLGWTASSWRGEGYSSVCQPGTPLYHCLKLRKSKFGHTWQAELLDDSDPADLFTDDPLDGSG
ncbi:MAG: hypothetical protein ACRDOL_21485 [Streptosporangiaceae bacterium]